MEYVILLYFLLFVSTFFLSYITNYLLLKLSFSINSRDGDHTIPQERWANFKPAIGGISFFIVFLASISMMSALSSNQPPLPYLKLLGLIGSCMLGFILGLSDDAYNTNPLAKFILQLCCGFFLIATDYIINISPVESLNIIFTLVWVIGLMNSINMLDNMDGITGTISAIIILGMIGIQAANGSFNLFASITLIGVLGGILGFIMFNWFPAKIYMGDTGSQFLGVFVAALSIDLVWGFRPISFFSKGSLLGQLLIPTLFLFVPIADTTTVTVRRILKGKSPFIGGKDHITHHLVYAGLSQPTVVLLLCAIQISCTMIGLMLVSNVISWTLTNALLCCLAPLLLFISLQFFYTVGGDKKFS